MLFIPFIVFASVVATGLGLVLGGRVTYRWLRRQAERRVRRRLLASGYALPEPTSASYAAPLWVAAIQVVLLVWLAPGGAPAARTDRLGLTVLASALLLTIAFALHGLPRHDRTLKYGALWLGAFLAQVALISGTVPTIPDLHWTLALFPAVHVGGTWLARHYVDRHTGAPGRLAFVLHRICMTLGPAPGIRAFVAFYAMRIAGVFPGYLMLRYFLRPLIARRPILYLRSFRDDDAHTFFGKILAPSVGSRAVLVGVIHEAQTGEELHRATDHAWHGEIYALPETAWQRWVEDKLASCAAVVIDMSIVTPSLEWELAQALAHLPRERILLVSRDAIPARLTATGVAIERYDLETPTDLLMAQGALTSWIDRVLREITQAPREIEPSADGSRAPTALALAGLALLLLGGLAACKHVMLSAHLMDLAAAPDPAASLAAFDRAWAMPQDLVGLAAALLLLAAWPLLGAVASRLERAGKVALMLPMAILGATSLASLASPPTGATAFLLDALETQLLLVAAGYAIAWAVHVHVAAAARLDVERTFFWLLLPAGLGLLNLVLVPVAGVARMPALLLIGGIASAGATIGAAVVMIGLLGRAAQLRTHGSLDEPWVAADRIGA